MSCKGAIRSPANYLAAALRRRTERFDHCFPRRITFGDIDSIVELGGNFLVLEWKLTGQVVETGQEVLFRRLVDAGFTVVVVWTTTDGDVVAWAPVERGVKLREVAGGERELTEAIAGWASDADASPRPAPDDPAGG